MFRSLLGRSRPGVRPTTQRFAGSCRCCCWVLSSSGIAKPRRLKTRESCASGFSPGTSPVRRRLRETLDIVDQLQAAGRSGEALKTIQWILDQPFNALVIEDRRPAGSIKRLAHSKLRSFPAEWKQQYERTYGAEARWLLGEARLRQDDHLAVEVLRRFAETGTRKMRRFGWRCAGWTEANRVWPPQCCFSTPIPSPTCRRSAPRG